MGSCEVPVIPSATARLLLYAKYGVFLLLLRLSETLALLLMRGAKLWLQLVDALMPLPVPVSRKPKSCWFCESRVWNCTLKVSLSFLLSGAFRRTLPLLLVLGYEVTSR